MLTAFDILTKARELQEGHWGQGNGTLHMVGSLLGDCVCPVMAIGYAVEEWDPGILDIAEEARLLLAGALGVVGYEREKEDLAIIWANDAPGMTEEKVLKAFDTA